MKISLLLLSLIVSTSAAAVGRYDCTGGPYQLSVTVRSEYQLIINRFDDGEIDWRYARSNPGSKYHRLLGEFPSLGGGFVYVSKSIFNDAVTARVRRIRRGANGIVTDNYRCTRYP